MPAPKGNKFWELRSKHGRGTLFTSPELLWEAACGYFNWCDDNPWIKKEAIKSGDKAGTTMDVSTCRPYSLAGFLFYIGAGNAYWRQFKSDVHEDFSTVICDIENVIKTQQFEGATVGVFNANIISRLLGLADRSDVTTGGDKIGFKVEVLDKETANEIEKL